MIDTAFVLTLGYIGGDSKRGAELNGEALIIQTLKQSGLVNEVTRINYDALHYNIGNIGEYLIEQCSLAKPDVIIFNPSGLYNLDPPRYAMDIITNKLGMKTVMVRGDSVGEVSKRFTDSWMPFVSNVMFFDATLKTIKYNRHPKAIQSLITAGQSSYFYKKDTPKDIDVCFIGNLRMPKREKYIQYLQLHGINVYIRGGQGPTDKIIPWEEYTDILNRSKISLNFCLNGCGDSQMKGRVTETMACNTLLIEDEGTETSRFFDEGIDFVMAHNKEDMLDKVKYYLEHDREREQIAASGHRKITELYTARNAWGYTFEEMGFAMNMREWSFEEDDSYQWFCNKMGALKR